MEEKQRKEYKKPQVVYKKEIETLAAVCDSSWIGPGGTCCMQGSCQKRAS